jgi:hypothetical protein
MVTEPLCKVCGERHGFGTPHTWTGPSSAVDGDGGKTLARADDRQGGQASKPKLPRVRVKGASKRMAGSATGKSGGVSAHPSGVPGVFPASDLNKPSFDRLAYQREYMRKRRAQARAKP